MLGLLSNTSQAWVDAVLGDFDAFLTDHAANERKASAMALQFVVRYPDRHHILEPLIGVAREELAHFHQVFKLMQARGLQFRRDEKDPYVNGLMRHINGDRERGFMDRLIMAGVIEARGCERFATLASALTEPSLRAFYEEISESESRHANLFNDLAKAYFPDDVVDQRHGFWLERDAEVIASIPPRSALH